VTKKLVRDLVPGDVFEWRKRIYLILAISRAVHDPSDMYVRMQMTVLTKEQITDLFPSVDFEFVVRNESWER
jgi:hypothetical protein